ncbi:hypothetical protein HYN48_13885 [Flavobacterium magnum]|uniref:Uncharacterized protein n=1 Tax=Flavobacterium magnum TaxID=2162713 RepID=A0A2S0RHS3_9FLAO|nr:hypothetical protein [Flavobacterium magnum]AWA31089.1 hypothetical protein HYN48_13885 [Flavobacterium magnum]
MMKILLVTVLFSSCCIAQTNRKAFKLEIAANETQQYVSDIDESPYFVKDKVLQIYCGESVFIECEITADSISSMKVVEKNVNPKKTIEIKFHQENEDRKNIISMLEVKNPFNKDLIYEAIMLTPASKKWNSTSIIPVRANLVSFETWPHPIISLALMNWQFKKA